MRARQRRIAVFAVASLLGAGSGCGEQGSETGGGGPEGGVSPLSRSEGSEDVAMAQRIRQALVADDSLSSDAKNATIVARENTVTLRGDVPSERERATIVAKVQEVAPDARIDNQLQVEGGQQPAPQGGQPPAAGGGMQQQP